MIIISFGRTLFGVRKELSFDSSFIENIYLKE
jgi:hypothetical protein